MGEQVYTRLETLEKRLAQLESATESTEKYGDRLHKYKEEILNNFNKYREESRNTLNSYNENKNTLETAVKDVNNAVSYFQTSQTNIHQGLVRLEQRVNMIWNTFNALVRFIENSITSDRYDHLGEIWTREQFENALREAGAEVFKEALEHERTELVRMKEQKASGDKITPMQSRMTVADQLLQDTTNNVVSAIENHRTELQELAQLRAELASNEDKTQK